MEDGRQIIAETYKVIKTLAEEMEKQKTDPDLEKYIESSLTWAKKCLNKVWLRSKDGTDLARGCLSAANDLKDKLDDQAAALDAAVNLSVQLESLARTIASKASVMT